jgi:hypothetical protein
MSINNWKFYTFNEVYDNNLNFNENNDYGNNSHINIENCKVYGSGDIHGDFYLLMNILLDLCKIVIIKDENKYKHFLKASIQEFPKYLDSLKNKEGIENIGIEWHNDIKSNTFLVLCGDLIDNKRNDNFDLQEVYGDNYIPYVELKILYLIYYLNYKARNMKNVGIIKVCGNHDYGNLKSDDRIWITNYSYNDSEKYEGYERKDYFNYKNKIISSRLLFHMIYPLVRINEHFFMHGGMNINYYNKYKNVIQLNNDFINCILEKNNDCEIFQDKDGLLWDRTMSTNDFYSTKIPKEYKQIFKLEDKKFKDKVLLVGHCPFIYSSNKLCNDDINSNYKSIFPKRDQKDKNDENIINNDSIKSTFSNEYNDVCDGNNHGITGQFWDKNKKRVKLIRLDVGMSHGFDSELLHIDNDKYIDKDKNEYYGRLPQIVEIIIYKFNAEYNVITATTHNALIRNKRGIFKEMDDNTIKKKIIDIDLINRNVNYRKYMKYKLKYNRLLKLI